jgi:2-keto-4-pentenoate hydratase
VRDLIGADNVNAAYEVQQLICAQRISAGARVVGRNIGLTSPAVQQQLGVDQPDFGVLFDDMEFHDTAVIPMGRLLQPKVEAEIAFVRDAELAEGPLTLSTVS